MTSIFSTPLSGSYDPADCEFLLELVEPRYHSVEAKERLIQSQAYHYSDLLNKEAIPSAQYQQLFHFFTHAYKTLLAQHVRQLAALIDQNHKQPIVLLSLARAGTPIGVLLKRALETYHQREVRHFTISIIRDRGIDTHALDYLIQALEIAPESLIFVDGWTAKGVITQELKQSIENYNQQRGTTVSSELYVISDCGGSADFAATDEDYPIPSSLLNATVSGLISRSIWQDAKQQHFHGCTQYSHLEPYDSSNWFIEQVCEAFEVCTADLDSCSIPSIDAISATKSIRQQRMAEFIDTMQHRLSLTNINHLKPGIPEATRVMLRRVPRLLIVRSFKSPLVQHLLVLAKEKRVEVVEQQDMLFEACALIKTVVKGEAA